MNYCGEYNNYIAGSVNDYVIHYRMWLLNQMALDGFHMESDSSRKRSYVPRSETVERFCRQPSTGHEGRLCSNKICTVFLEGNIRKISVLPIFDNTG